MWKQIERLDSSNSTKTRLALAKALALEAEAQAAGTKPDAAAAKLKAAMDVLEPLLKGNRWSIADVEAALELSRLYGNRAVGRFDDAKKTLDYIVSYLGVEKNITVMEIPPGLEKPYISAAKDALSKLKYSEKLGLAEFEAAEKLRKAQKFAEAIRAYQSLIKEMPDSAYSPRADMYIGNCLVGLRRQPEALAHWKRFIEVKPAGEYRAQALIALIDTYLEEQLNLAEASKYCEIARASLPTALADEKANPSWKDAMLDLQIRVGMVAFCTGRNEDAAGAFAEAKKLSAKKTEQESFDSLIAAAQGGKSVIPDDAKGGGAGEMKAAGTAADKVSLALSMGVIYLCADRTERAQAFFDRVLGIDRDKLAAAPKRDDKDGKPAALPIRPMQGVTPAQVAFGLFGEGAVYAQNNKDDDAKEQFLASMKAFESGSWTDETLWRLASIVLAQADAKFGKPAESSAPSAKPGDAKVATKDGKKDAAANKSGSPAKSLTPQEREAQAKAEKERLAALAKAKEPALDLLRELVKKYPKSPRCESAQYLIGLIQYQIAEAAPSEKSEQLFKDAAFTMNRFCETWPKSQWAGSALTIQLNVALERMFDLKLATALGEQAMQWVKDVASLQPSDLPKTSLPTWSLIQLPPSAKEMDHSRYECGLRAGLVAYLNGKFDEAISDFKAAGAAELSDKPTSNFNLEGVGLSLLTIAIEKKRIAWREDAIKTVEDERQKTAIKLADLYLFVQRPDRTIEIYNRFLTKDPLLGPVATSTKAYAMMQLAWAYRSDAGKVALAKEYLQALYAPECANLPWVPFGLVRFGALEINGGSPEKAMPHFEQVLKKYPQSPEAKRALYFYAIAALKAGKSDIARAACQQFLENYSDDAWAKHVKSMLNDAAKIQTTQKNK